MENVKNKFNINYPILAFIVFQLIFIISSIVLSVSYFNKDDKIEEGDYEAQPHISIENLSDITADSSAEYNDIIEALLLNIVQKNIFDINLSETKAEIRDGVVYQHYFSRPNINYASAIIDIPAISQSYQLFFQYSDEKQNKFLNPNDSVTFLCIEDPSNIIYPDFDCKDIYSQKTRNAIVYKYLQFFNFDQFGAGVRKDYTTINIEPSDFNNVDQEAIIGETRQAIASLGISPDLFKYYVMQAKDIDFHIEP